MRTRQAFVIASGWALLVVLAVHFPSIPGSVPDFNRASGGGVLFDASPAFTLSVLPFLFLLTRRAVARFSLSPLVRALLLSAPVVSVAFDLLDNVSVLALLANYPERMNVLAASLPSTTVVKRAASLLALGIPLAMVGFQFMRRRQSPPTEFRTQYR
jgi:hypothetical protein